MRTLALLAVVTLVACSEGHQAAPSRSPSPSRSESPAVSASPSPAASPPLRTRRGTPKLQLVGRFDSPVHVVAPPGDSHRLFVVEQGGTVRVVRDGRVLPEPFLDVSADTSGGGEQGLLSLAFSPDYARDRLVYVDYTDLSGDTRVVEFAASASNPDRADPGSRRELLSVDQPFANHNGGLLIFDPDGMLIVGLGDGGSGGDPGNRAQDLGTLLGKLLRIDPHPSGGRPYGVPRDNPFVDRSGARPEIWAYGLRNPWRFSFDRDTGDLYLADVGQNQWEEVNVVPRSAQSGANYGWRAFEGLEQFRPQRVDTSRLVRPVLVYDHGGGRCSITGGFAYRGTLAALRGRYLYADVCAGTVWSIPAGTAAGPAPRVEPFRGGSPVSFGENEAGELYVVSHNGEVWLVTV